MRLVFLPILAQEARKPYLQKTSTKMVPNTETRASFGAYARTSARQKQAMAKKRPKMAEVLPTRMPPRY